MITLDTTWEISALHAFTIFTISCRHAVRAASGPTLTTPHSRPAQCHGASPDRPPKATPARTSCMPPHICKSIIRSRLSERTSRTASTRIHVTACR